MMIKLHTRGRTCKRHTKRYHRYCLDCIAEDLEAQLAEQRKMMVADHCKGCVWLNKNGGVPSCGAVNCVRENGWVAEDWRVMESIMAGH